jgi:hypothetical protein
MPIPDLFSRRQRQQRGDVPDVYQYDVLPEKFRVQVWHIITDALGREQRLRGLLHQTHRHFIRIIEQEHGIRDFSTFNEKGAEAMHEFFFETATTEQALDIIELYFELITSEGFQSQEFLIGTWNRLLTPEQAVDDLNIRFRENGIGYQFESGQIIRVDSEFLHAEIVKPALSVLSDSRFSGANEEFLTAHEHYRHGRYEDCLISCGNAFESTMITICTIREWEFAAKDNAANLVGICLSKGLVPTYFDCQLNSLRTLLTSGVPMVRNKEAGHGKGVKPRVVPDFMASYALHLTATTILFMADANAALDSL